MSSAFNCTHVWMTFGLGPTKCARCGAIPFVAPHEPESKDITVSRSWTLTGWKAGLVREIADDLSGTVVAMLIGAVCGCVATLLTLSFVARGGR